jgi:hypothetical protein
MVRVQGFVGFNGIGATLKTAIRDAEKSALKAFKAYAKLLDYEVTG